MKPAKASKRKPPVYVISGNEILTIPFDLNETTQHPDGDGTFIPDTLMVSVKCNTCRSTAVLVGQDVEESERHSHDEGMGDEIFYSGVCGGECESCHSYLEVEVDVSKYADGWIFQNRTQDGCELVEVLGFEDALRAFAELSRKAQLEELSRRQDED